MVAPNDSHELSRGLYAFLFAFEDLERVSCTDFSSSRILAINSSSVRAVDCIGTEMTS